MPMFMKAFPSKRCIWISPNSDCMQLSLTKLYYPLKREATETDYFVRLFVRPSVRPIAHWILQGIHKKNVFFRKFATSPSPALGFLVVQKITSQ